MMNTGAKVYRRHPSLFPYIKTGQSGIHIDFLPKAEPLNKKKPAFPFETLGHSDPLAHLVKARLVTDAGSQIEHLFILLQRDQVQPEKNISLPTTNPATNQCWQLAFSNYCEKGTFDDSLIQLGGQLANNGCLLPFQPLLYCSFKKQFFPPPCPICGGLLDLCCDDNMLISTGLQPYSTSLRRYLFCPTCHQLAGETDFYTCLSMDQDEDNVKNYLELISEFKKLAKSANQIPLFPCRGCSEIGGCHAPKGPMKIRISPFAFYPFYMLIFKADSVNTADLALLAASKNDFVPSAKPNQDLLKTDKNQSIKMILQRLIVKWQMDAAKHSETPLSIDAVKKPSRMTPSDPLNDPTIYSSAINGNPDFQETRIVPVNRGRPLSEPKTDLTQNQDFPETIIVTSEQMVKPGINQPDTVADGENHLFLSTSDTIERNDKKQGETDVIPETMIIRPAESASLKSRDTRAAHKNKTQSQKNIQEDHLSKIFSFKKDDLSNSDAKLLKTFRLDRDQINQDLGEEIIKSPPETPQKVQKPYRLGGKDELDQTVIVQPKKTDKEKK